MRAEGRRGRTGPGGAMTESYFSRNADNSSQNALPKNPGSWIVPSVGRGKEIQGPRSVLMGVWAIAATVGSNLAHLVKLNIGRPYNTAIPQLGVNPKYIF